ncbi:MAG: type II toxin-antitoxin system VapC family toxin [Verrucomicrobiota bacterium]
MASKVYIETTVVSYLTSKPSRDVITAGHQQTTVEWWETRRTQFDLFTSQFVLDEASLGDPFEAGKRNEVLVKLLLLVINAEVTRLGRKLIEDRALPPKAATDALHVAISSVSKMDYLLTWNCRHLANATLFKRVAAICQAAGHDCPIICTPEELMEI